MAENVIDELLEDAQERMHKSVETAQHEFSTVRTGRASPGLLDRVTVDYYGAMTPLNQLATISAPEARLLTVTPYDKTSIKAIEKSINESDIGLTPSNDGNLIRLVVPELTEERRKDLVKIVRNLAEEGRIAIRNVRRDTMQHLRELKNEGEASSDDEHRAEVELQKLTDGRVERPGRCAQGQGRGDPRGLMELAGQRASADRPRTGRGGGRRRSERPDGPLRGDHHRRQRPLGERPRGPRQRGPQRRRRHGQGSPARRRRAGDRGADGLLLLDRELVPAR